MRRRRRATRGWSRPRLETRRLPRPERSVESRRLVTGLESRRARSRSRPPPPQRPSSLRRRRGARGRGRRRGSSGSGWCRCRSAGQSARRGRGRTACGTAADRRAECVSPPSLKTAPPRAPGPAGPMQYIFYRACYIELRGPGRCGWVISLLSVFSPQHAAGVTLAREIYGLSLSSAECCELKFKSTYTRRSRLALRDWAGSSAEATDHANIKPATFIRHDEQSQSECPCSWVACSLPWLWS